ncbi:MAG: hypothetical protein ACYDD7_10190, partial [Acidimicrobiales bacterium]
MRVLMLEADERMLDERRRLDHDRFDEMWDGVLHMVPPPTEHHQHVGTRILIALDPYARAADLRMVFEGGVFARPDDYRQP